MTDELIGAIKAQQANIERLTEHVALLTHSVAMLLGEEMGKPVDEPEEDQHRTMDGEGLRFRNRG